MKNRSNIEIYNIGKKTLKERSEGGKKVLADKGSIFFKRIALKSLETRYKKGQIYKDDPQAYEARKLKLEQEIAAEAESPQVV